MFRVFIHKKSPHPLSLGERYQQKHLACYQHQHLIIFRSNRVTVYSGKETCTLTDIQTRVVYVYIVHILLYLRLLIRGDFYCVAPSPLAIYSASRM